MPKQKGTCDSCEAKGWVFRGGNLLLCHKHAHDLGLSHTHPEMEITDTIHHHINFKPWGLPQHLYDFDQLEE